MKTLDKLELAKEVVSMCREEDVQIEEALERIKEIYGVD